MLQISLPLSSKPKLCMATMRPISSTLCFTVTNLWGWSKECLTWVSVDPAGLSSSSYRGAPLLTNRNTSGLCRCWDDCRLDNECLKPALQIPYCTEFGPHLSPAIEQTILISVWEVEEARTSRGSGRHVGPIVHQIVNVWTLFSRVLTAQNSYLIYRVPLCKQ